MSLRQGKLLNSMERLDNLKTPEKLPPEKLVEGTVYTKDIWKINKAKGVQFVYKDGEWTGYSHRDGIITLGSSPVPTEFKQNFNLAKDVPDIEVKKYMFSHENMHHVLFDSEKSEIKNIMLEFLTRVNQIRQTTGDGLSRLGSISFYKEKNTSHEEDVVEMLNLYSQNPKKLESYLEYLVNANPNDLRVNGQSRIGKQTAKLIFDYTEKLITSFLDRNNKYL